MRFSVTLTVEVEGAKIPLLSRLSWRRRKAQVRKRDGATCRYCGGHAPDGQPDHILPLSRGGTDDLENLAWACPGCNQSKGDRTLQEWAEVVTILPTPYTEDEDLEDESRLIEIEQQVRALWSEGVGLSAISDMVFGYHNARKTAQIKDILGLF